MSFRVPLKCTFCSGRFMRDTVQHDSVHHDFSSYTGGTERISGCVTVMAIGASSREKKYLKCACALWLLHSCFIYVCLCLCLSLRLFFLFLHISNYSHLYCAFQCLPDTIIPPPDGLSSLSSISFLFFLLHCHLLFVQVKEGF